MGVKGLCTRCVFGIKPLPLTSKEGIMKKSKKTKDNIKNPRMTPEPKIKKGK